VNAAEVIEQAKKAGVSVKLVDGKLRASRTVGAGAVPTDALQLLRDHRDVITAHLTAQVEDSRFGKVPDVEDEPPMRAAAPRMTDKQILLVADYVRRQRWPQERKGAECPFTWAIIRADAYAHRAKDKWEKKLFLAAAALDLVCWQRRAADAQVLRWLEEMDGAHGDLREKEKTNG